MPPLNIIAPGAGGGNFVDVQTDWKATSNGPGLCTRNAMNCLIILLHDATNNVGCLAHCSPVINERACISSMIFHMVHNFGSTVANIEVLIAGGGARTPAQMTALHNHLLALNIAHTVTDARPVAAGLIGNPAPNGLTARHVFYVPQTNTAELCHMNALAFNGIGAGNGTTLLPAP